MSLTQMLPPGNESLREAERLRGALLDAGVAAPDKIAGCTEAEISEVVAAAGSVVLPDQYLAFLQVMGQKAGHLLLGTSVFFPEPLDSIEAAEDIASSPKENLTLAGRFFFGHHQGYIVYFFENCSDAIYGYKEGHPEVEKLGDTLFDWLWQEFEDAKELMDSIEQREADIGATTAKLRAEGEIDW